MARKKNQLPQPMPQAPASTMPMTPPQKKAKPAKQRGANSDAAAKAMNAKWNC